MMPVKIIIVDDELFIAEEMYETLTDEGYECLVASNVDDTLALVKNTKDIHIIITDLKMPKKTGADLIAAVEKEFGQQIKFIVMSGHGSPIIESNGVDVGSYPFLRKPLNIYDLLDTVAAVLKNKET
jgi:DNA-binding NtrC family response regulator|tara:strand:- start:82 stop:462 length:381 start_codon:yes stop_codon:yes gene_type:complete